MKIGNRSYVRHLMVATLPAALTFAMATSASAQEADTKTDSTPKPCATDASTDKPCTSDNAVDLSTVKVRGVRASVASAITLKQNATQITDSIVAEDVGKLPDNSVAAALQRVTGVQVARGAGEVNTVLVRGLPDVVTTLNGRNVFTTTGRFMALADIPADLLQRVDVYKTSGADKIEGGIGGLIDVRLRRPFDFDQDWTVAGSFRDIYSRNSGKADPNGSLTANKIWHTDAGKFGVLASVSYQSQRYEESNTFNGIYNLESNPLNPNQQIYVPATDGAIYSLGDRTRHSANLTFQWAPNDNLDLYFENFYVGYRSKSQSNYFVGLPSQINSSNATGVTLKPGTNIVDTISGTNVFTLTSNQAYFNTSDTYQSAFGGTWHNDRVTISSDLAYTYSKAYNRDFILDTNFTAPEATFGTDDNSSANFAISNAGGSTYDLTNPSNYSLFQYYDGWSKQDSKDWSWKTDASFKVNAGPLTFIDVGYRVSHRTARNIAADTGGRTNISGQNVSVADLPGLADITPGDLLNGKRDISVSQWFVGDRSYLLDNAAQIRALMGYDPATPLSSASLYFNDQEDDYAGYLQGRYSMHIGDMPLDGAFGVRVVRLNSKLHGTQELDGIYSPVSINEGQTNALPSFTANLSIRDDLLLRFSYGKSLTRPAFASLNPQLSLYQSTATVPASGSGGNAYLKPIKSENLDMSLEWYFRPASLLSLAVFNRDIDGYIQTYAADELINGITYSVSRPRNTGKGHLRGVEAAYTQFFDFLPGWLSGFGIQLNGTYIDAATRSPDGVMQDLVNVSKNAYNAILLYQNNAFSARLAYNWRSKYALSYTASGDQPQSIYVAPTSSMDFAMNYDINKHFTLSLEATNLLGKVTRNYFGDASLFPRDVAYTERTFTLGGRFRF